MTRIVAVGAGSRRAAQPTARCSSSTTGPIWSRRWAPTGSHVGQDDVTVRDARATVGPDRLVGLSTHSPEQIDGARARPSTTSGSALSTRRRPSRGARPSGSTLVRYAAAHATVPFFAIGGISPANVGRGA